MWPMTQSGLATAIVDFTSDLSPLIIGLLGLLGLSAGFIVFVASREHLSRKIEPMAKETHASEDHRDAA
jgi:hypothetical protein